MLRPQFLRRFFSHRFYTACLIRKIFVNTENLWSNDFREIYISLGILGQAMLVVICTCTCIHIIKWGKHRYTSTIMQKILMTVVKIPTNERLNDIFPLFSYGDYVGYLSKIPT